MTADTPALWNAFHRAAFTEIRRDAPKLPIEMWKEGPDVDLLSLIHEVGQTSSIIEQQHTLADASFVDRYADSWLDIEARLVGMYVFNSLFPLLGNSKHLRFLDLGCGAGAQFAALASHIEGRVQCSYFAQDYLQEWQTSSGLQSARFRPGVLPQRAFAGQADVVACAHVLQYMLGDPTRIVATVYSVAEATKIGGYCYFTIPAKVAYPGLGDFLEEVVEQTRMEIVGHGRARVLHDFNPGVTTFDWVIARRIPLARQAARNVEGDCQRLFQLVGQGSPASVAEAGWILQRLRSHPVREAPPPMCPGSPSGYLRPATPQLLLYDLHSELIKDRRSRNLEFVLQTIRAALTLLACSLSQTREYGRDPKGAWDARIGAERLGERQTALLLGYLTRLRHAVLDGSL